jgi:GNAT superfamily N-acetyltransferase
MISFAWETGYDEFYEEAKELILAHWNEVGTHREVLPFNPRHDVYRHLEKLRLLEMLVARDAEKIVGYFFIIYAQHPRSITKIIANDDVVYADPKYRGEMLGYRLTKLALERAKRNAHIVAFRAKNGRTAFLRRLGFIPRDTICTMLGDL